MTVKQQTLQKFKDLWGEAPPGSLKHQRRLEIEKLIGEALDTQREEIIKEYRPTLDMVHVTDWLRGFGLEDEDTLTAGEVEELLTSFVDDHSLKGKAQCT